MKTGTELSDEKMEVKLGCFWGHLRTGSSMLAPWSGSPFRFEIYKTARRDSTAVFIVMADLPLYRQQQRTAQRQRRPLGHDHQGKGRPGTPV